jgi:hypothetical protein
MLVKRISDTIQSGASFSVSGIFDISVLPITFHLTYKQKKNSILCSIMCSNFKIECYKGHCAIDLKSEVFKNSTCAVVSVHRTGFFSYSTYFRKSDIMNRKRVSACWRTYWFCVGNKVLPDDWI